MTRQKKDYVCLSMRVDAKVMERFSKYCEEVGQTKTLAFERMAMDYIDRYEEERKLVESLRTEK